VRGEESLESLKAKVEKEIKKDETGVYGYVLKDLLKSTEDKANAYAAFLELCPKLSEAIEIAKKTDLKEAESPERNADFLYNKIKEGMKGKEGNDLFAALQVAYLGCVDFYSSLVEEGKRTKEQLDFIIMQLVRLMEKGQEVKMSKRAGVFIELKELINEVGLDVARFFFLARAANSHLVFNLELAKKKSQENPVYYVQYAYARINSILAKSNPPAGGQNLKLLDSSEELNLIKQLIRFPEVVEDTAKDYQIQRLPQYSIDLAESFHRFYEKCQVISDDKELTNARLALLAVTKIVFENTFNLMGISAPEKM